MKGPSFDRHGTNGLCMVTKVTKRATKRPNPFDKPAHWDNSPPPEPAGATPAEPDPESLDPTRYGDWVKNGLAVDF